MAASTIVKSHGNGRFPAGARRCKSVLLVEDHLSTLRAMSRLLWQAGFDVRAANSFEQAVELAECAPFDLLITDLLLPTRSGWELLQTLSSDSPMPAIAISAYSTEDQISRSKSAGFLAHLVKPINLEKLHLAIEEAMAEGKLIVNS